MASESDFPFSELEAMFDPYLEFKIQGEQIAKRPDERTSVPLNGGGADIFYRAQMLQKGLDIVVEPNTEGLSSKLLDLGGASIRSILTQQAIEELNSEKWRHIFDQRLAVSTFMLSVFDKRSSEPRPYNERIIVSGNLQEFNNGNFEGHDTLVALFTTPRFIDPDGVSSDSIDRLAVPVLGIAEWCVSRT